MLSLFDISLSLINVLFYLFGDLDFAHL
uniref:Uncharacterized protein n=1 Tax=Arundo donax TaxID=35708 RepID=A0A0A9BBP7_ARUDO